MGTVYQDALERGASERMENPEWAALYSSTLRKMRSGEYGEWLDVIVQNHRSPLDLFDASAFLDIWTAIQTGKIYHCVIPIGNGPSGDAQVEENNRKLPNGPYSRAWLRSGEEREIHVVFSSEFWGGTPGPDGSISWAGELPFFKNAGDQEPTTIWVDGNDQFPYPLEAGYCRASQTWWRLGRNRRLVRWPYGYTSLWFLWVVDHDLWVPDLTLDAPA